MTAALQNAPEYDVVICGAGPVGLSLALALAKSGLSAAILTPDDNGVSLSAADGRAYSVSAGGWRMLRALGVAAMLENDAEPIMSVSAEADGFGALFGFDDMGEDGAPLGYMIEADVLSHALMSRVSECEGLSLMRGMSAKSFRPGPARMDISVDGPSGPSALSAGLVAGCDGRASSVRKLAGLRTHGRNYRAKGVVATVFLTRPHQGAARQTFLPSGPFAVLPLKHNRANLVWTERAEIADALAALSDADFEAELAARVGEFLGPFRPDGPRAAFPLVMQVAESLIADRVALAGDAAHVIHPLAGQGLNLGLRDAAALADVLYDARYAGLDIGSPAVLNNYERWRRADIVATTLAMEALERLFSAPSPLRRLAGLGMTLTGASRTARRFLTREAGGVTGEAPRLFREEAPFSPG